MGQWQRFSGVFTSSSSVAPSESIKVKGVPALNVPSSVTRLHEHRLRYQTLQPHAQKCATHSPRRTNQFSEKTGPVNTLELILQALWQICLPKHIPRPKFDVSTPNIKQTLFFFHTTLWGMVGPKQHTNTLFRTPQRCRNAAARGPKIFRMGRLASCCGLFSERRSHSLTCKNPLWSSKKRPFIPSRPPLITDLFACARKSRLLRVPFFFAGSELFRHGGEQNLFQGISRQPEVEGIGVYLDQLVIPLVEELVQSY